MSRKKIIVSVTNDLVTDNRVQRVCDFLHKHDFEITLVGRKLKNSLAIQNLPYKTKRFRLLFNKGPLFYAAFNLRLFFYLLFRKTDFLLANDLDTLLANHYAKKFKSGVKLIYDSHEYFTGVPELTTRPKIQKIWKRIEKKCLPKVDAMYTVNQSIADLYKNEYGIESYVVRNISSPPSDNQTKTRKELGLPEDKKIIIFQGAGINVDRGAEELIEAIKLLNNSVLIFVGSGDVIPALKLKVETEKLNEKVKFFDKVPYRQLLNFTTVSDLGVSLDKDSNINYRYSLPNKLFDYIHCGIPVLVSDLPEIKKIVLEYDIGLVISNHQPEEIAKKIEQIFSDAELYAQFKKNTQATAANLNWVNECRVLEKIYL
jgi:glycosyltransferase involved in cell wall biosynthesis